MVAMHDVASSLVVAVADERRRQLAERATQASDDDLDQAAAILRAAMRADRNDNRNRLAGMLGRLVTDHWSLTSDLSARLVDFDQHFLRGG